MCIRLFCPLFRVWLFINNSKLLFSPHNNISHKTHKERNGSEEQQHSSVLTTMSAPSSPDGGNGEEDDAAAVGMNYSIAEALIRRYTSACLELSSSSNSSSFASSSTSLEGLSPSFLNASSSVGTHGGGNDSNDVGGGTSAAASASTSASSARMEDIRRKYGTLLDALAAIAPTHARVLVENLVNWEKEISQRANAGEPVNTINGRGEQQKENALCALWLAVEAIVNAVVVNEEGTTVLDKSTTNKMFVEFLAPLALGHLCERARHHLAPKRKFWLKEDFVRASIEKTVEEHRVDARLSDRERDGISLDETVKKESRAKDLLTPDERVRGGSNMRDILMRTPSKDKDRSLQYSPQKLTTPSGSFMLQQQRSMKKLDIEIDQEAALRIFREEDDVGLAISRVIASLFSISFDEALDYFVGALKSRLTENQRTEANWIMFAVSGAKLSLVAGAETHNFGVNIEHDEEKIQNAVKFLKAFNPTEWIPPSRAKPSNFRHGLCVLLSKCIDIRALDRSGEESNFEIPLEWTKTCIQARVFITEWAKTNEKHLEDATPLLATLFAWELAGTLREDNAIMVADNSGKHPDLIEFCDNVSRRAKKFKGKSAEAVDVARRFFRVAKRRLNGSNSNDKVITDKIFSVLEAGMDALASVQPKDFVTYTAFASDHEQPSHVRFMSVIALSAAYRVDKTRAIKIALRMLSKTDPSDAVAVAVNVAASMQLKMKSSFDTIELMEHLQRVVARAMEINQSMYSDSGYTVSRNLGNEQLNQIRGSYPTLAAVLRCIPNVEVPNVDPINFVPHFITHTNSEIRVAAAGALSRLMLFSGVDGTLPSTDACNRLVQAASSSLLNLRDTSDHSLRESAAKALTFALNRRRAALNDNMNENDPTLGHLDHGGIIESTRPEAAGLVLLCDPVPSVRLAALALLREVSHFQFMDNRYKKGQNSASKRNSPRQFTTSSPRKRRSIDTVNQSDLPRSVASVIDECRFRMYEEADSFTHTSRGAKSHRSITAEEILGNEALQSNALCSAIGVLARSVATPCKAASVTARAQALQRVQAIMVLEGKGSMMQAPTEPGSHIFELWRNYACFVCSATDKEDLEIRNSKKKENPDENGSGPKIVTIGSRGSLQTLFQLTVPSILTGKGGQLEAILNVLERVPPFVVPKLLDACADVFKSIPKLQILNTNTTHSSITSIFDSSAVDATSVTISGGNMMSPQSNMNSVTSVLYAWMTLAKLYKLLVIRYSPFIESTADDNDTKKTMCENIAKFVEEVTFIATIAAKMVPGAKDMKDNDMKPLAEELKSSVALIICATVEDIPTYCATVLQKQSRMKLWTLVSGWVEEALAESYKLAETRNFQSALASILGAPAFDESMLREDGPVFDWIDSLLEAGDGELERVARNAIVGFCSNNPLVLRIVIEKCYSAKTSVSTIYFSALAIIASDAFNDTVKGGAPVVRFMVPAHLVTLSYFNLISLDAQNRENARKLIKAIFIVSENTEDDKDKSSSVFEDGNGSMHASRLLALFQDSSSQPELPEVHYNLLQNASEIMVQTKDASKLAPELLIQTFSRCCFLMSDDGSSRSNDLQLNNTIRQVLIALKPWVRSLKLEELTKAGKRQVCNRLLLEFYDITKILSRKFGAEIESLWGCLAMRESSHLLTPRNLEIALDFLLFNGVKTENVKISNMMISGDVTKKKNEENETIESFEGNLFLTPKRACLYLARVAPQECIDRLVRAVSFRALEPEGEIYSNTDAFYHSQIEEPDLATILLAEIAAEHDEYFRSQLIVLVHAVVATIATSRNALVCAHCQQLLANLLHKLAGQPLVRRIENYENDDQSLSKIPAKDQRALVTVQKLQKLVGSRGLEAGSSWNDSNLDLFCHRFPDCMVFEASPRERWSSEALRWVSKAKSFTLALASMDILGALRHPLDNEEFRTFLGIMCTSAAMSEGKFLSGSTVPPKKSNVHSPSSSPRGSEDGTVTHRMQLGMKFTLSILVALRKSPFVYVRIAPQTFWFGVACLRSTNEQIYEAAVRLVTVSLMSAPLNTFGSSASFSTYAASAPLPLRTRYADSNSNVGKSAGYQAKPAISLQDVVPLLLKGTLKNAAATRGSAATALASIAPYCASEIWGGKKTLACVLCGLLPIALYAFYGEEEEEDNGSYEDYGRRDGETPEHKRRDDEQLKRKRKKSTFGKKEAMVALQLLAEGCRLVSPVLEDTLHCIIVSRDSLEQNSNDENKDEYHRLTGMQKSARRAFGQSSNGFEKRGDGDDDDDAFGDFKGMYKFLNEFSGVTTLEQACELLAQPLFDGFLVPNDCVECAITLLGDIANSSAHHGNAEGALHLLCAAATYSPSVRDDISLYGETGVFHALALETMERQQKRNNNNMDETTTTRTPETLTDRNEGLNENIAMKMLKSVAMNYSAASKVAEMKKIEKEEGEEETATKTTTAKPVFWQGSLKRTKEEPISDLTWGILLSANFDPEHASLPASLE